jgi:hypothetical protein
VAKKDQLPVFMGVCNANIHKATHTAAYTKGALYSVQEAAWYDYEVMCDMIGVLALDVKKNSPGMIPVFS